MVKERLKLTLEEVFYNLTYLMNMEKNLIGV